MRSNVGQYRIGEVYLMYFEGEGSEQRGWRPGLVFQNNTGNFFSPNIIALPLTSSLKKSSQPTHVVVLSSNTGLKVDSMVLCENPKCMSKNRIGNYITTLSNEYMAEIAEAFILATSAISFLAPEKLVPLYKRAILLNGSRKFA